MLYDPLGVSFHFTNGQTFFFEGNLFYEKKNFIWKTSILKTRTIKSIKEEEISPGRASGNGQTGWAS